MTGWTLYRQRHPAYRPKERGPLVLSTTERLALALVDHSGSTVTELHEITGLPYYSLKDSVRRLEERRLATRAVKQVACGWGRKSATSWHTVPLMRDVVEGRDHPGTPLGELRTALETGGRTLVELAAALPWSSDTLRTVLRVLVVQGDLRRERAARGEVYLLPLVADDDDADDQPLMAA